MSLVLALQHPADRHEHLGMFSAGGMLGGFFATNVGSTFPLGIIDGWRLAFHAVAAVAFVTTGLVLKWAVDPRPPSRAVISPLQLGDERGRSGSR